MKTCYSYLTFFIGSYLVFAQSNPQQTKIDILSHVTAGQAMLTASAWDIGHVNYCFDGDTTTLMRSAHVNPAFVQIAFTQQQTVRKIRVLLGQPGYPNIDHDDWWVEIADTQNDLDSQTGTWQLIVPRQIDVAGDWDEATFFAQKAKIWKFTIERTIGDGYVHIPELQLWGEFEALNKFLIIVSNPLFETGLITNSLITYQNDLANEGWQTEVITVNKNIDANADYVCPSEVDLKNVIRGFYKNGYQGFVIIGSSSDIPTVWWRHHTKREVNAPTDLYYADMDEWVDLDGNGIYETWDSKLINSVWDADRTKPANPDNIEFDPELFFGRIDAGPLSSSSEEEANHVNFYFNKIHDYRTNGSPLSEEAQRSALFFRADEYAPNVWDDTYKEYMPNITCNHGIMTGNVDYLTRELQKGYIFASIATHSGNSEHAINEWIAAKRQFEGFSLDEVRTINPKVHFWVLFACSAAKFTEVNFGATYLFETDYVYNVCGSTGLWGVLLDPVSGQKINDGESVGIVYQDWVTRIPLGGDVCPKGALHGDPLLTYPINNPNKPPQIHNKLNYEEASVNEAFQITFEITDPENDPVVLEIENLPDNATLSGYTLSWTPTLEQADSTFHLKARAKDSHNNSYAAIFTIYVNIVRDGLLNDLANWQTSGDGSVTISGYEQPFKSRNTVIQTLNNWGAIQQQIVVDPYRLYRLEVWIGKQLTLNSNQPFLQVDELGQRFVFGDFVISNIRYDEGDVVHTYCAIPLSSGKHVQLTLSIHSGELENPTSGKLYLTGLRLVDEGESKNKLFTKVLTGRLVNDGGYSNGPAFCDFTGDGYADLFVSNHAWNNFLYKNNRDGTFSKITNNPIVFDNMAADDGVWGDYNDDGYPDLFVSNWSNTENVLYKNNGNDSFTKITGSVFDTEKGTSHEGAWTDFNNDGFLDIFVPVSSDKNLLYAGNGTDNFSRITSGAVVNEWGTSIGACWGDYDGDFNLDLFVANGYDVINFLYKNNGDGTFTKITSGNIVNDESKSIGARWGDYDNDGNLDLFVFNYANENNLLYNNNGDGTFRKVTTGEIVNDGGDSQDARWGDFDLDGDLDLFVANIDKQNNFLYSNNGDGSFTKITDDITVNDGGTSPGCNWADIDLDGDLDLFVANSSNENNFFYTNNNRDANNWLRVTCKGNRAIAAKIGIKANIGGKNSWQWRDISGNTIYGMTAHSLTVDFGVRKATVVDSLMVKWPTGYEQVLEEIAVNRHITVEEPTFQSVAFGERGDSDYSDVTFDSHIRERAYAQERNYGATDNIRVLGANAPVGEWRGLIKFDFQPGLVVEGVTDPLQIIRAELILRLSESEGSGQNTISLYRILRDWGEGNKNNKDATIGEVTWKSAKNDIDDWTQAGAKSINYDHDPAPVATTIIGNDIGRYYSFNVTSSVREMFTAQQNYGWLMVLEEGAGMRYFSSKEAANPKYRPSLIIYCSPATVITNDIIFAENDEADFSNVTSDAHIREFVSTQNRNYGATDNIRILGANATAKEWTGLLKFDFIPGLLAQGISNPEVIVSAKVRLYLSESEGTKNDNLYFHRLLQDWGEGTGNNNHAKTGEVSWISPFHYQNFWQIPGGDYVSEPDLQQSIGNAVNTWYEFDITQSVRTMFADGRNFGWLLKLDPGAGMRYFRSKECKNPFYRPQLIVSINRQQAEKAIANKSSFSELPVEFALYQNYPNPFNPTTTIEFVLPEETFVNLKIYNVLGEEITTLLSNKLPAGNHKRVWNAGKLPSGIYLYCIQAGNFVQTKKLILLQ